MKVTTEGRDKVYGMFSLFETAYYDDHSIPIMTIFEPVPGELDTELLASYNGFSSFIFRSAHWGFTYGHYFELSDPSIIFNENIDQLELYTTYTMNGNVANLSYSTLLVKVSPFEVIVVSGDFVSKNVAVGLIDVNKKSIKVTTKLNNYRKVLGELHSQMLPNYLERGLSL